MDEQVVNVENKESDGQIKVIKVGGFLDITTADEIERVLQALIESKCYNIIIDLENVEYISSSGWGILISHIKEVRDHGGDLKLARMKPEVYEVFEVLEFFWIFKSYETLEDAIDAFKDTSNA